MIQRVARTSKSSAPANPVRKQPVGSFSLTPTSTPSNPSPPVDSTLESVATMVSDLERQRRGIDRLIQQAARGRNFSPAELLVLQARVYTYGQEMEVVSRMVDKTVAAVKTTLNTQV